MRQLTVLGLMLLLGFSARSEEIVFEMSVFGIKFGTMVITRTAENDSTELYTLHAQGKTDFLWMQREEQSKYEVRYINGKLFSSDYIYTNKGETEKWSKIQYTDGKYLVESSEGSKTMDHATDYSLLRLYFEPNWNREKVFCEEDCSYAQLVRNEEKNTLKVICQDGSKSTYHINDGEISDLEIHLAVATVKLKRIK